MTREQVASFAAEYETLVRKYLTAPGEHPEGSRQMAVRLVMLPDEGPRPDLPAEMEPDADPDPDEDEDEG